MPRKPTNPPKPSEAEPVLEIAYITADGEIIDRVHAEPEETDTEKLEGAPRTTMTPEQREASLRTLASMREFEAMRRELGPWPTPDENASITADVLTLKHQCAKLIDPKKRKAIEKQITEKVIEQQILLLTCQIHQTIARIMDQLTRTGEYDIKDRIIIAHLKREIAFLRDGMPLVIKAESFVGGKPKGALGPVAKKIVAYLSKHPDAKPLEVWNALKKSPPKDHVFMESTAHGKYIEKGAFTVMGWARFSNIVSERRPKK